MLYLPDGNVNNLKELILQNFNSSRSGKVALCKWRNYF